MKKKKSIPNNFFLALLLFLIVIGISSFLLFSNKNLKYSINEKKVLGISDSLKIIELNYNQFRDEILTDISIKLNKETCCEKNVFLLKLDNNNIVNVKLFNHCKKCPIICGENYVNRILINSDNQILVNENLIQKDLLISKLESILEKSYKEDHEYFSFEWDKTTKKENIEFIFLSIQKAYLKYYKKISEQKFHKDLSLLTQNELEEVNSIEFNLFLGVGNRIFDLIPPPKNY